MGQEMSEATQQMIKLVQGDLYEILSQLFEMKETNKKLEELRIGSCTKSICDELSKGNMIFSEESSHAIYEMGNMEWVELRQTSVTLQCPSCLKHLP